MRKRWEFEDLFDFVNGLVGHPELAALNLRHFDPTQAFTRDRVDKGLVESLMLKRAKCTVYSVQDTDTLGKDSELAATLAQGKPVIADLPTVNVEARAAQPLQEDPTTVQDRLRLVLYAGEQFAQSLTRRNSSSSAASRPSSSSSGTGSGAQCPARERSRRSARRTAHGADLERLCRIVASSEARIYDRRARTLQVSHPPGIQVNLATGVANGVLVVRTIPRCAELLRKVVTNTSNSSFEKPRRCGILRRRFRGASTASCPRTGS